MTYLNEKRRSLINSRPIIGTNHTVTSNTSSLVLPSPLDSAIEVIEIQGKTEQNGTPDKDTPVDIVSTGDNGLKVEVRGKNLCDISYFEKNYTEAVYNYVKIYVGKGNSVTVSIDRKLPSGLGFYFCVFYGPYTGSSGLPFWVYHSTAETYKYRTFISEQDYIYLNINGFKNFKENVQYLQVEINDHATEYEPYFEPTGVSINTQLCGIDGYYDALTVDWSNSTVRKRAKIESINIKDCKIERLGVYNTKKFLMYYIDGVRPPLVNEARPFGWGLCTHGRWAEYNVYAEGLLEENLTISLYNGNIALYIPKSFGLPIVNEQSSYHTATVEALLEWIGDRDIIISYIAKDDNEEDLTDKLSSLFSLSTKKCSNNILEAQGASKITATYYSNKYEDKLSLTVSYVDENGATVKGSDSYQVREGSLFSIIPPPISGYEPTVKRYDGCIKEKCEITITYKEKQNASL